MEYVTHVFFMISWLSLHIYRLSLQTKEAEEMQTK